MFVTSLDSQWVTAEAWFQSLVLHCHLLVGLHLEPVNLLMTQMGCGYKHTRDQAGQILKTNHRSASLCFREL